MKKLVFIICCLISSYTYSQDTVSLSRVTAEIDMVMADLLTIQNFQNEYKPSKASISLGTDIGSENSGEIKILIFKIGGKRSVTRSSEMSFEYKISLEDKRTESTLEKALSRAIKNAYISYMKSNPKYLKLEKFSVKVSFVIERSGSAGGEIEFKPITIGLGRSISKKMNHSVEIEFTKSK